MKIPYFEIHMLVERAEINYILGDNSNPLVLIWIDKVNKWLDSCSDKIKNEKS